MERHFFLFDKFLILDPSEVELYSRFNSRRETLLPTKGQPRERL